MVNLTYWKVLTRRKTLTSDPESESRFHRVLGTFDLTALGVGATLGVGVYVLAGHVARDQAGPSVVLSFAIAAIASFFAGLCYAEFGARVPKAGSAYIYSYVCIGEFAAFIIGWNLLLEYIIGSASVSRGISLYLDALINDTLRVTFMEVAPIRWEFMGPYFDFFAFSLAFVIGVCLAFGLHASTMINNIFTVLNIGIVLFVIIAGSLKADLHNWQIDPSEVTEPYVVGKGGFFPFGFEGTLRGAATCFFGFVGFDCIATTGEEVKDPRRAIPRSILISLTIIFLSYFGVSTVLTLMWPYYLQDVDAPLPYVFQQMNWPIAKWIVTVGGMVGLFASLFGAMFPLPRIIYAMSQDGLIFRSLGRISPKYKTPIFGNICAALLTGLMAALFDLTQLVNMLSIGTLLAYTVVAISITILRFMPNETTQQELEADFTENTTLNGRRDNVTCRSVLLQIFNTRRLQDPTHTSIRVVGLLLLFYCLCCFGFSLTLMCSRHEFEGLEVWTISLLGMFLGLLLILLFAISIQPKEKTSVVFRVPLVPFIPGISIFVNIYLMLQLDLYTWIRFGVWMAVGIPMYLVCICLYNKTAEVRNLNLIKTHHAFSENWKIKFNADDEPHLTNGAIPKANSITSISIEEIGINEETNERSQRKTPSPQQSLDEILPVTEVAESHKEIKNSNGKTFFIEDTPPKEVPELLEEEDAKSVIAMLDNVLLVEDSVGYHNFNRKASIDSEMIPSFIETSTVATVHSSYDSLKEEEAESAIQINNETANNNLVENYEGEEPSQQNENQEITTKEICLDKNETNSIIETSEEIAPNETIEVNSLSSLKDIQNEDATNVEMVKTVNDEIVKHVVRQSSQSSINSFEEDAIHSKSFKEKLSRLLGQVPPLVGKLKQPEVNNTNTSEFQYPMSPILKPSKSEPDFKHLIGEETAEDLIKSSSDQKISNDVNEIPKPPKFDPLLYKTVGTRRFNQPKERPKLEQFGTFEPNSEKSTNLPIAEIINSALVPQLESSPIPFKKRLENLLSSGPSHMIAKILPRPTINITNQFAVPNTAQIPNNQSDSLNTEQISQSNNLIPTSQYKEEFTAVLKSINNSQVSNDTDHQTTVQRPTTIEEARKNLRHVHAN